VKEIYEVVGRHASKIVYAYNRSPTTCWQEELEEVEFGITIGAIDEAIGEAAGTS
jgi:hypothetical protein